MPLTQVKPLEAWLTQAQAGGKRTCDRRSFEV